jgi:hypothetical protein
MKKKWTSIAVIEDTHSRLEEMKTIKAPGKMENFDDVIRRKMDMPPVDETEVTSE